LTEEISGKTGYGGQIRDEISLTAKEHLTEDLIQRCKTSDINKIQWQQINMGGIQGSQAISEENCFAQYTPWVTVVNKGNLYSFSLIDKSEDYSKILSTFKFITKTSATKYLLDCEHSDCSCEFSSGYSYDCPGPGGRPSGLGTITITLPNGDGKFVSGQSQTIKWSYDSLADLKQDGKTFPVDVSIMLGYLGERGVSRTCSFGYVPVSKGSFTFTPTIGLCPSKPSRTIPEGNYKVFILANYGNGYEGDALAGDESKIIQIVPE
jgi:hypothetical protein